MRAITVLGRAQVGEHRTVAHVIVSHVQVGERQGLHRSIICSFLRQGTVFHELDGGVIIHRGTAVHGAAQGGQGSLVVARLHVDHAQLPVGIGVGRVEGQGLLGIAGGNEELTLLGVGLGDGDVRQGVLDPERSC